MASKRVAYMTARDDWRSDPRDRRTEPRYEPKDLGGRIGWWEKDEFIQVPAEIIDISRGGVRVALATLPPESIAVYLHVGGPENPWVESSVAHRSSHWKRHFLRLAFRLECPYDVIRKVAFGMDQTSATPWV